MTPRTGRHDRPDAQLRRAGIHLGAVMMVSDSGFTARTDDDLGVFEVELSGDIDLSRKQELRQVITLYARAVDCDLVVDLGRVTFLDATGLAILVDLHREARVRGRRMSLRHVPAMTRRLIEITGLGQLLADDGSAAALAD